MSEKIIERASVVKVSRRITIEEAEEDLAELPLVPVIAGSIAEMKALRDRCLEHGIPVLIGCPPGAGKG